MAIALFSRENELPAIPLPENIYVAKTFHTDLLHKISGLTKMEIERRFMEQNDAWVLWADNIPAAFGWVARVFAPIGELERFVKVPEEQVYLWNFRTMEPWRGKGFYPVLLQQIIKSEMELGTEKLWIIAKPENKSSYRGMIKAGFTIAGELSFNAVNDLVLLPIQRGEIADEAAAFLNVPIVDTKVKPCWCCNSTSMLHANDACNCLCNTTEDEICHC